MNDHSVPDIVQRAREVALRYHGDQKYGENPYFVHLDAVVGVLKEHGLHAPHLLAAGYLHDTLEDTDCTREALRNEFGETVVSLVDAVTDGEGASRKEKKARSYRLINTTPEAVVVKLADRIANVRASIADNPRRLGIYASEHSAFRATLYHSEDALAAPLWSTLDRLLQSR